MPNIASVLKSEISRIARKEARKEVRADTESLKKAASVYRSDIAALKRRVQELERQLKHMGRLAKVTPAETPIVVPEGFRFSAKGLAGHRKRLGLSAEDCGLLLGASGQSVYNWESAATRPQDKHLAAIALFRSMGRREALARLEALR